MAAISNDWLEPLQGEFKKPYYKKLYDTVLHEYQTRKIFPAPDDIFNAFSFTPLVYDLKMADKENEIHTTTTARHMD